MYHEDTAEDLRFAILETEGSQSLRIKVRSARQGRALSCSQLNARAWTIATTIITEAASEVWPDSARDIDVCRQSQRALYQKKGSCKLIVLWLRAFVTGRPRVLFGPF